MNRQYEMIKKAAYLGNVEAQIEVERVEGVGIDRVVKLATLGNPEANRFLDTLEAVFGAGTVKQAHYAKIAEATDRESQAIIDAQNAQQGEAREYWNGHTGSGQDASMYTGGYNPSSFVDGHAIGRTPLLQGIGDIQNYASEHPYAAAGIGAAGALGLGAAGYGAYKGIQAARR